jgi:hypothetical protein
MDHDKDTERDLALDQLMERASASVQKSLDATVDVQQRLRDLLYEAGVETGLVQTQRSHQ